MGAPKIKRKIAQHERHTEKLLRLQLATVSIVQDTTTGKVLAVGIDHASAVAGMNASAHIEEGSWEVKDFRVWR